MVAEVTSFGRTGDGRATSLVTLRAGPLTARVLDFGARLMSFRLGDGPETCVAGTDIAACEGARVYAGPVVAPVINRISWAAAEIEGTRYRFAANDGENTLHSGPEGAHVQVWTIEDAGADRVTLSLDLPDGAGGFPGRRRIEASYRLDRGLEVTLSATTEAPTLMNPGLHGVFCPDGETDPGRLLLEMPALRVLPVTPETLPTGEIAEVAGTAFDFRRPAPVPRDLDHNFCFEPEFGLRARLTGTRGTTLVIRSDAPGLQVYGGGTGVALEPQLWPDAPGRAQFPSILLRPGETFRQRSVYGLERG